MQVGDPKNGFFGPVRATSLLQSFTREACSAKVSEQFLKAPQLAHFQQCVAKAGDEWQPDWAGISFRATASHTIMVRKPGGKRFHPRLAHTIEKQDSVSTRKGALWVADVEHHVDTLAVVEVRLMDTKGSFFAGDSGTGPRAFLEVCGALAPLASSVVELLHFQRFDRFREIVNENFELKSCRDELEEEGYNTDLGVYGLGSGKLLVRSSLAQQAIEALHQRVRASACSLRLSSSDIVVSTKLKVTLLEQVKRLAPRVNPVVRSEILELGPRILDDRSFATVTAAPASSDTATNSSTDAHIGPWCNPRKRAG